MRRKGFTLIELLVVIAIIALLVSILAPSVVHIKDIVKQLICASGMRQIGIGWANYTKTHGGMIVGGCSYRPFDWVRYEFDAAGNPTTDPAADGALYPYVGRTEVYKCTNPIYPEYPISYSVTGTLNGTLWWEVVKRCWDRLPAVTHPDQTLMLIEEDDMRGFNMGSWVIRPDAWSDFVAGNHMGGDNVVFADGRVEYWKWQDPRTLTMPYHIYGPGWPADGSVDHRRLWDGWIGLDQNLPY